MFEQLFQVRQVVVDDNNVRDALYVHVNVDVVCGYAKEKRVEMNILKEVSEQ